VVGSVGASRPTRGIGDDGPWGQPPESRFVAGLVGAYSTRYATTVGSPMTIYVLMRRPPFSSLATRFHTIQQVLTVVAIITATWRGDGP
jgi:hypothetical protein